MTQMNQSEQKPYEEERVNQTLGTRISEHRKKHNLTQEEFSLLLGVTPQAVSKWENDASCPDIMLLPEIAKILEVSIDELMGVKPKFQSEKAEQDIAEPVADNSTVDIHKLKFKVRILDNKGKKTNVSLPMGFVMRIADVGVRISGVLGTTTVDDSQIKQILELVKNGVTGEMLDFTSDDGTNIKIEIS